MSPSLFGGRIALPSGYQQVTDGQLLALAARNRGVLVTFDRGAATLAQGNGLQVKLLGL